MKTWEMLRMITDNPNLKFKGKDCFNNDIYIQWTDKNYSLDLNINRWMLHNAEWELIKESVDFMTAIKAYAEGKTIRCEIEGSIFHYVPLKNTVFGSKLITEHREVRSCNFYRGNVNLYHNIV